VFIIRCTGDECHFKSANFVDKIIIKFRKYRLLGYAKRIPTSAVKSFGRDAAKIADPRERDANQTGHEIVHPPPAQRHLQPDDVTCGPTCLAQVYRYYRHAKTVREVIQETPSNPDGGTMAVIPAHKAVPAPNPTAKRTFGRPTHSIPQTMLNT